jgi:hypothetical protein
MPGIPVDRVFDKKIIIGEMEGQGGKAQGVADPPKSLKPFALVAIRTHDV